MDRTDPPRSPRAWTWSLNPTTGSVSPSPPHGAPSSEQMRETTERRPWRIDLELHGVPQPQAPHAVPDGGDSPRRQGPFHASRYAGLPLLRCHHASPTQLVAGGMRLLGTPWKVSLFLPLVSGAEKQQEAPSSSRKRKSNDEMSSGICISVASLENESSEKKFRCETTKPS